MRLLLAEDEKELANALCAILTHNRYSVDAVHNGADALDYALYGEYDGIILDIMMPKMSGLEVLSRLREEGVGTPVLLLTAKSETSDRIAGLDTGADDYLPKPFDMGELLARIRAMTRRKEAFAPNVLAMGHLSLNRETFEARGKSGLVRLGGKEFQMLEMLMRSPGSPIPTERFMEKIWGFDAQAEINVVWVGISYLRKKLETINAGVQLKAVRGLGYLLEEKKA